MTGFSKSSRSRRLIMSRFWDKVEMIPFHPCWEWKASKSVNGYGKIRWEGKSQLAHRVSWELHFGLIPTGLQVCHSCDNRTCVRPDHLFLGTAQDNTDDMMNKSRWINGSAIARRTKKSCRKGHSYEPGNTYWYKGQRFCERCRAAIRAKRGSQTTPVPVGVD